MVLAFIEINAVRAVRVNAEGARPWGDAGIVIADTRVTTAAAPKVLPDGAGGAFISWLVSSPRDLHVQHLDAGGLFFAWETTRGVHIHHMNGSGMIDWELIGTLKPGELSTDPDPAQPGAFYLGRESATD